MLPVSVFEAIGMAVASVADYPRMPKAGRTRHAGTRADGGGAVARMTLRALLEKRFAFGASATERGRRIGPARGGGRDGCVGTCAGGDHRWRTDGVFARWREHARCLAIGTAQDSLTLALGPDIGQCCGGRVTVMLSVLTPDARAALLARLESAQAPTVMILGAGHVGRALAQVLAPLPLPRGVGGQPGRGTGAKRPPAPITA